MACLEQPKSPPIGSRRRTRGAGWAPSTRFATRHVAGGRARRRLRGAPVDHADGFIHFSTAAQAAETAAKHFAGASGPDAGRGRCRRAWRSAEVGALARRRTVSRISTARCRSRRCAGRSRCRAVRTAGMCFRSLRRDRLCSIAWRGRCCMRSIPRTPTGSRIKALKFAPLPRAARDDPRLAMRAFGLNFPNPIGMAAGFDKNAEVPDALLRLGFGFVEVGTITPLPQPGNPRPRLFRLDADRRRDQPARLQFAKAPTRCSSGSRRAPMPAASSASMSAPTRIRADRVADYVRADRALRAGRELRHRQYLLAQHAGPAQSAAGRRARRSARARRRCARARGARSAGPTPVLLKIAPDLSLADLDDVVGIARSRRVDGMIVGNTTLARPPSLRETETAARGGRPVGPSAVRARQRACWPKLMCGSRACFR